MRSGEFRQWGLWKSQCPHQAVPYVWRSQYIGFSAFTSLIIYMSSNCGWNIKRKYCSPGWYSQNVILSCHSCSLFTFRIMSNSPEHTPGTFQYGHFHLLAAPLTTLHSPAGLQLTGTTQCSWLDTVTYSWCLLVKHTCSPGFSRSYM